MVFYIQLSYKVSIKSIRHFIVTDQAEGTGGGTLGGVKA